MSSRSEPLDEELQACRDQTNLSVFRTSGVGEDFTAHWVQLMGFTSQAKIALQESEGELP